MRCSKRWKDDHSRPIMEPRRLRIKPTIKGECPISAAFTDLIMHTLRHFSISTLEDITLRFTLYFLSSFPLSISPVPFPLSPSFSSPSLLGRRRKCPFSVFLPSPPHDFFRHNHLTEENNLFFTSKANL